MKGDLVLLAIAATSLAACTSIGNQLDDVGKAYRRYLILTADDYGASENITQGIEYAVIGGVD